MNWVGPSEFSSQKHLQCHLSNSNDMVFPSTDIEVCWWNPDKDWQTSAAGMKQYAGQLAEVSGSYESSCFKGYISSKYIL